MNTILLNSDESQLSLGYSRASELRKKVFGGRKSDEDSAIKVQGSKYSPAVLLGNWFEERAQFTPLPCNRNKINVNAHDTSRNNRETSHQGRNHQLLPEYHGNDDYDNNFSTCYDLSYRVLPKDLDGPIKRTYNARINKWVPEQDLTKNYGNITGYGMTEYLRAVEEDFIIEANEKPRSNYQCDYRRKEIPSDDGRYHRRRFDLNTPDVRHLNINSNTCWSRYYLGRGFNKSDICKRVACGRY